MAKGYGGRQFWTAYRRHYVHTLLNDGVSPRVIAERLGCDYRALVIAIRRFKLHEAEPIA